MNKSLKAVLASALIVSSVGLVAPVSAKPQGDGAECDRGKVQATDVLQQRQLVESAEVSLSTARTEQAVLEH